MVKKKIFVNGYSLSSQKISGVGRYLEKLLKNKNVNFDIVVEKEIYTDKEKNNLIFKKRGRTKLQKILFNLFAFNGLKPKAIHNVALDFSIHSIFCKSIYTIHDLCFLSNSGWYTLYERIYLRVNLFLIVHFSSKIITVSENTKKDLLKYYPKIAGKVKTVYIPLNISQMTIRDPHKIIQKFDLDNSKYFISPTNKHPRKNLHNTIQGFKDSIYFRKGYKLVLTGEGEINSPSIINTNHISELEYLTLLKFSEGIIYFPYYEGFGVPILECIENKIPILLSNNSSLAELFENEGLMCNIFENSDGITSFLNEFYTKNLAEKTLKQLDLIKYKFNPSTIEDEITRIYEETFC